MGKSSTRNLNEERRESTRMTRYRRRKRPSTTARKTVDVSSSSRRKKTRSKLSRSKLDAISHRVRRQAKGVSESGKHCAVVSGGGYRRFTVVKHCFGRRGLSATPGKARNLVHGCLGIRKALVSSALYPYIAFRRSGESDSQALTSERKWELDNLVRRNKEDDVGYSRGRMMRFGFCVRPRKVFVERGVGESRWLPQSTAMRDESGSAKLRKPL
jgi:hypothetical protein